MRSLVGIFCSLQSEFLNIVKQYSTYKIVEQKKDFCVCITNKNTIVVLLGIGNSCAYHNASYVLQQYEGIKCVISTGIAGSLFQKAQLGDYVLGDLVIHYTEDNKLEEYIPFGKEKNEYHLNSIIKDSKILRGLVISSDIFIHDRNEKEFLKKQGGICVEMEAAGVIKACNEKKLPCTVVKIISDTADKGALKSILKNQEELTIRLGRTISQFSQILQSDF